MLLNVSQTWHQVRPGEMRADCGGCHAHSQRSLLFESTAAGKPGFVPADLTRLTPVLSLTPAGETLQKYLTTRVLDVEFHRDIKPILQRSCVACHSGSTPPMGLRLDDSSIVADFDNTYNRLANDAAATYGIKPVINGQTWRGSNASRYVRKFQSRRSLLMWKLWGERLDGWINADHPSEATPGNASTLPAGADRNAADIDFTGTMMPPPGSGVTPLGNEEKLMFARWIDLGAPVDNTDARLKPFGWFNDEQKPVLTLTSPTRASSMRGLTQISFGAYDNYSGLDRSSLSVKTNFAVDGQPPGTELIGRFSEADHVWTYAFPALTGRADRPTVTVTARDMRGNESKIDRVANSINCNLDVNGDGAIDTLDARTIMAWMLGFRETTLLSLAGATPLTASEIQQRIEALRAELDLDGDNIIRAHSDGVMLLRLLLGARGAAVTQSAANMTGTRTDGFDIARYISASCGVTLP